jgi:HEAT repeat protein
MILFPTTVRDFVWLSDLEKARLFAVLFLFLLIVTSVAAILSRVIAHARNSRWRRFSLRVSAAWVRAYSSGQIHERDRWSRMPPSIVAGELGRIRSSLTDAEDLELITLAATHAGVIRWLTDRAKSRAWWVRAKAAEQLGLLGGRSRTAAVVLNRLCTDENEAVRVRALRAASKVGLEIPFQSLLREFDSLDRRNALIAADAVLESSVPSTASLSDWKASVRSFQGLELAIRCGTMKGLIPSLELFEEWVHSPDTGVRIAAVLSAEGFFTDEPVEYLAVAAKHDPSPDVRSAAVKMLASLMGRLAIPHIAEVLANDPSHVVQLAAAESACSVFSNPGDSLEVFGESPAVRHVVGLWRIGAFTRMV